MRKLFILLAIFSSGALMAQKNTVWGYLRDSVTNLPIPLASVTNVNTGKTVMTSSTGRFKIELSRNQSLSFAAVDYHFDTMQYSYQHLLQDTLQLTLRPLAHSLGNVTVTSRWNRYQRDSIERREEFLKDVGNSKIPTVSTPTYGAGVAFNLDRYSKREKSKRKAHEIFEESEKEAYINYRFPSSIVQEYTGLKDDALQDFMQRYRPSAAWLRAHTTEEDIKYYLNDKLKLYFKR